MATVYASEGDDSFRVESREANTVYGLGGDDYLIGRGRDDTIDGGTGDDSLFGGNGYDHLIGGEGNDTLLGANGGDRLDGGFGDNVLVGGNGNDTFVIDAAKLVDAFATIDDFDVGRQLRRMTYNDRIEITNADGADIVFQQNGEVVELFVDGAHLATFNGSEGALTAEDLRGVTRIVGEHSSVTVTDAADEPERPFTGVAIHGVAASDNSGRSVASAGDVDGDGLADVLIGAFDADPLGRTNAGETYLLFGSAISAAEGPIDLGALQNGAGVRITGISANDRSGFSVASAGDVDGDGLADVVVGAYLADPDGTLDAGETYLVYGATLAASDGTIDLGELTAAQGVVLKGAAAGDFSGWAVASAGDVDGDGKDDLIVGARAADPSGTPNAGESYLVYGSTIAASDGVLDLADLAAGEAVRLKGLAANDNSGSSVASAGDVDGDGVADLLISAPTADPDGDANAGETYLVFGSALTGDDGTIDLGALSAGEGVLIKGAAAEDISGSAIASAGDVDGDGLADIVIGARGAGPTGAGEAYVLFGAALAASDGVIDLSALTADQGVTILGVDPGDLLGWSVASAGDVDGDGLADVMVSARDADPDGRSAAGETTVIFGAALAESDGVIDLSALAPSQGVVICGIDASDLSGSAIASAGDVDGDGRDDVLIGAFRADPDGRADAGESYVVSGAMIAGEALGDGVIDLATDLFV